MIREEGLEFIAKSVKDDVDMAMVADAIKALSAEPCEDAISRQSVIDTTVCEGISCDECSFNTLENGESGCLLSERVTRLPSVNPKPKMGHWEQYGNFWEDKFKCSECGKEQPKILCGERIIGHWSDYCPNCGCRMVEPQESENKE